jgi:hypothetical protein
MSLIKIRAALENTINGMSPALATCWENTKYAPVVGTPYQIVYIKEAPENPSWDTATRWNGILYVRLMYPQSAGTNAITTRAGLLLTAFARTTSHTKDTVTCIIYETPEFNTEGNDGDRFVGLFKAKFYTNLI